MEAFVLALVAMELVFDGVGEVTDDEGTGNAVVVGLAIGFMICTSIATFAVPTLVAPGVKHFAQWCASLTPFIISMAAHMAGAPMTLMWAGWCVSVALLAIAALMTPRTKVTPQG
jgi:hypothetical protein